jgi:hypothetical protein
MSCRNDPWWFARMHKECTELQKLIRNQRGIREDNTRLYIMYMKHIELQLNAFDKRLIEGDDRCEKYSAAKKDVYVILCIYEAE